MKKTMLFHSDKGPIEWKEKWFHRNFVSCCCYCCCYCYCLPASAHWVNLMAKVAIIYLVKASAKKGHGVQIFKFRLFSTSFYFSLSVAHCCCCSGWLFDSFSMSFQMTAANRKFITPFQIVMDLIMFKFK